jgi:hypothetical protein
VLLGALSICPRNLRLEDPKENRKVERTAGIRSDFPGIVFRSGVEARYSVPDPIGSKADQGGSADPIEAKKNTGIDPSRLGTETVCPWVRIIAASRSRRPRSSRPRPSPAWRSRLARLIQLGRPNLLEAIGQAPRSAQLASSGSLASRAPGASSASLHHRHTLPSSDNRTDCLAFVSVAPRLVISANWKQACFLVFSATNNGKTWWNYTPPIKLLNLSCLIQSVEFSCAICIEKSVKARQK